MRVTVDLEEDLYELLRRVAYIERRTMSDIVRDLLRQSLPDRATEGSS